MESPEESVPEELRSLIRGAWKAFAHGEMEQCAAAAELAITRFPDHGDGWYVKAACLEREGRFSEADRLFRRASFTKLNPHSPPFRVTWSRFESLIDVAREAVPEKLRAALDEVSIILADYAEPALIPDETEDELLGLFVGQERADRADEAMDVTPCIYVYRRAHEHHCVSLDEMAGEVAKTLYHEFGHYLGYDEEGLEWMGMD